MGCAFDLEIKKQAQQPAQPHILPNKKRRIKQCFLFVLARRPDAQRLNQRLNANEVDVSQFWLERVTLYSLNFNFGFFTVDNQSNSFRVELRFNFHVLYRIMVQFDRNWSSRATVNDSWEFVF